jgi:hypothetical protein
MFYRSHPSHSIEVTAREHDGSTQLEGVSIRSLSLSMAEQLTNSLFALPHAEHCRLTRCHRTTRSLSSLSSHPSNYQILFLTGEKAVGLYLEPGVGWVWIRIAEIFTFGPPLLLCSFAALLLCCSAPRLTCSVSRSRVGRPGVCVP